MNCLKYLMIVSMSAFFAMSAQAEVLKGKKLRKEVTGKTVYLSVASGVELPIKYRRGGVMYGKLKGLIALIPTGMPSKDKGRWWISRDRLCQTWNKWLGKKKYCYKLSRVNGQVRWKRNDGRSGTARIASQ